MNLVSPKEVEDCKCKPIAEENIKGLSETTDLMASLMEAKRGIGLAAPQVGIFKRFFIMKNFRGPGHVVVINPEITRVSEKSGVFEEGCLTYPWNYRKSVRRPKQIWAQWRTGDGGYMKMKLTGREAQVFHHEYEHLEGLTIKNRGK
jgi:peptide deformylase